MIKPKLAKAVSRLASAAFDPRDPVTVGFDTGLTPVAVIALATRNVVKK